MWSSYTARCLHVSMTPEEFLRGSALGRAVYERVFAFLTAARPDVTAHASKSQLAFRRERGFAYLWRPEQYLGPSSAPLVLAIARREVSPSSRFKEVAHPSRHVWMHHLEVRDLGEVDPEVESWLLAAADEAAPNDEAKPSRVSRR